MSLIHGVCDFENGQEHGEDEGATKLCSGTDNNGKEHGRELRWSEDITMDQLPSSFFLGFFNSLELVVPSNILAKGPDHDGSNGTCHEQDDHQGVDNGIVVNVIIGRSDEVNVPAICPCQIVLNPLNIVTVNNIDRCIFVVGQGKVLFWIVFHIKSRTGRKFGVVIDGAFRSVVSDTDRVDIEPCDADSVELTWILMVSNGKLQVVVQEDTVLLVVGVGGSLEPDWVPTYGIVQLLTSHQHRQSIQLKLDAILALDEFSHPTQFLSIEPDAAHGGTLSISLDVKVKGSRFHVMSLQSGSKIFPIAILFLKRRLRFERTSRQIIIFVGNLGLLGLYQVRIDPDGLSLHVLFGRDAREQNLCQGRFLFAQESLLFLVTKTIASKHGGFRRVGNLVKALLAQVFVSGEFRTVDFLLFPAIQAFVLLQLVVGFIFQLLMAGQHGTWGRFLRPRPFDPGLLSARPTTTTSTSRNGGCQQEETNQLMDANHFASILDYAFV